jgi:hypothetical protein
MGEPARSIDLSQVVQLAYQLHEDQSGPVDPRVERDQRIAQDHSLPAERHGRMLAWLAAASSDDAWLAARRTQTLSTLASVTLVALGLVIGGSTAAAVFAYDGSHPINITAVVGVFVGLQLLTVLLTIIAMIPQRVPGFAAIQRGLMQLSPGRLGALFARFIPETQRQKLGPLFGRLAGHQAMYSRLGRWLALSLGQQFGVAFNVAALAVAVTMIATTDLAFGWSTTLDIDAEVAHRIFAALAAPWAWAWPDLAPSAELVDATRMFRGEGVVDTAPPELRGQWWGFAVMVIWVYGFLPRCVLLFIARWRRAAAARDAFANMPGTSIVLARLTEPSQAAPGHHLPDAQSAITNHQSVITSPRVIAWADPPAIDSLTIDHAADGAHTHPGDVVAGLEGDQPLLVVTRGWEPPVAELFDYLAALREATSKTQPILLLPVGFDETGNASPPSDGQLETWRRRAAAAGDPWISVVTLAEVTP